MYTAFLIPLAFVACFIVYHVLRSILHFVGSSHRRIPGPLLARFTNFYYLRHVYSGGFEYLNMDLHRRYRSSLVRVAPDWYSISDPKALKVVYGPGAKFAKAAWYEGWKHPDPNKYSLFTDRNIQRHAQDRKKFSSIYSMSAMVNYEQYVDDCGDTFSDRLHEFADDGSVLDLAHWLQCYAFDVIGKITYSKRFGFLDAGDDVGGLLSALESQMKFATLSGVYSDAHPTVFPIVQAFGGGAKGRIFLESFGNKMWREREEEESLKRAEAGVGSNEDEKQGVEEEEQDLNKPTDMLAKFVQALNAGKPGWTRRDVASMTLSNIIAGSDTTAVSLSSIFYHLLKYPQTLQKLRNEIEELGKENISFKDSQEMPYLQAVIKEALRLHPATGLPLWRVVPEGGAEICGHWFKGGETVGANPWVIHYDTDVFGSDAAVFRPERWLEERDEDHMREMERSWIPFGLGSRTCIGRNISMLEICKLVPRLVREFEFHVEKSDEAWKRVNYWFVKQVDFGVTVTRRNQKA